MKVGFVSILGLPNVGKSTLINAILSKKVSIVTSKSQTTRDAIMGVYNEKDLQIVYIDTPGLFPGDEALYQMMEKSARRSMSGVDVILYVIDSTSKNYSKDDETLASIKSDAPIILLFNKIDDVRVEQMEALLAHYNEKYPNYEKIQISAKTNFGLKDIKNAVVAHLSEGLPYYPEDVITDKDKPFMAKEAIREELLRFLKGQSLLQRTLLLIAIVPCLTNHFPSPRCPRSPFSHSFILRAASAVSSALPKADRRKYPSPQGPKPSPGVPMTWISRTIRSKKSQLFIPSGHRIQT